MELIKKPKLTSVQRFGLFSTFVFIIYLTSAVETLAADVTVQFEGKFTNITSYGNYPIDQIASDYLFKIGDEFSGTYTFSTTSSDNTGPFPNQNENLNNSIGYYIEPISQATLKVANMWTAIPYPISNGPFGADKIVISNDVAISHAQPDPVDHYYAATSRSRGPNILTAASPYQNLGFLYRMAFSLTDSTQSAFENENLSTELPALNQFNEHRFTLHFGDGANILELTGELEVFQVLDEPEKPTDTDGDGLWDHWESTVGGVWEKVIDAAGNEKVVKIDLHALGADPYRYDIFVEIDYMQGVKPTRGALDRIVKAFANAPLENTSGPERPPGIALHIDGGPNFPMIAATESNAEVTWGSHSQSTEVARKEVLGTLYPGGGYNWKEFDDIKNANFSDSRRHTFHYALFVEKYRSKPRNALEPPNNSSGLSRGIGATDFMVALRAKTESVMHDTWVAGVFMHELGHNLGLNHSGSSGETFNPNHISVMNYSFIFEGVMKKGVSQGQVEKVYDYSRFKLPTLFENKIDESHGLGDVGAGADYHTHFWCPGSNPYVLSNYEFKSIRVPVDQADIDWNCDGVTNQESPMDLNFSDHFTPLESAEEWSQLKFKGGAVGGAGLPFSSSTLAHDEVSPDIVSAMSIQHGVRLDFEGDVSVDQHGTVIKVPITNYGETDDTYTLSVSAANQLIAPVLFSDTLTLLAGQSGEISILLSPERQVFPGIDEVLLKVQSQDYHFNSDTESIKIILTSESGSESGGSGGGLSWLGILILGLLSANRKTSRFLEYSGTHSIWSAKVRKPMI